MNQNQIKRKPNESDMITVIIPVYKVQDYLERCINSVLQSTYRNLEVICINDGSPDNCLEILQDFAEKDSRVVVISQENQGVQAARNAGLLKARGEYIAFIDSDDYIHPQYFSSMMRCLKAKSADIVICGCQKFSESQTVISKSLNKVHYDRLDDKQFFKSYYARHMVWARIYKRTIIGDSCFRPEVKLGEDTLFNLEVVTSLNNPVIYETKSELYYYFIRETSLVHTTKGMRLYDIVRWYRTQSFSGIRKGGKWDWLLLMQVIKIALSCRYGCCFDDDASEKIGDINADLKSLIAEMNQHPYIDIKDKVVHTIMFAFPELYRQFRIHDDPTLRIWEKERKGSK